MSLAATAKPSGGDEPVRHHERRAFGVACGAHVLHDGYTDVISVMLPVWQAEFGLGYATIGLLRGAFSAMMAGFQIPAGMIADRFGAGRVLAAGTALSGLGFCLAGASTGIVLLAAALLLAGLGSSTQHPIASSIVARAFAGPRSLKALGGYNFAGDVGKMIFPAATAFLITLMPWRPTIAILGAVGFAAAFAILVLTPRFAAEPAEAPKENETSSSASGRRPHYFPLLLSIGIIDSATRAGFLTFMPFVLIAKGASLPEIGIAFTLVFAGGAAGKLVCAFIGARIGVIATMWLTESLTAIGILALLPLPLEAAFLLLPVIGVALNGTSSVLYGSVPDLVDPVRRTRAFGIFYTGTIGGGAIAPALYGLAGDAFGIPTALALAAAIVLITLPLGWPLRPAFAGKAA